jgi:hypothetical protein
MEQEKKKYAPLWNVRGVSPLHRAKAKAAAELVGMKLGEWLEVVIDREVHNIEKKLAEGENRLRDVVETSTDYSGGGYATRVTNRDMPLNAEVGDGNANGAVEVANEAGGDGSDQKGSGEGVGEQLVSPEAPKRRAPARS